MLTLFVMTADGSKYNVTKMLRTVTWSGDINTMPRKLEITFQNADELGPTADRLIATDVGSMVFLYSDNIEVFRGFIFQRSIDQTGNESFTAYDELIYATKNNDTILVTGQTASDVINAQMLKFGIKSGSIQQTSFAIPKKLYTNQTLVEIWQDMLIQDKSSSGLTYVFTCDQGVVSMCSRDKAAISTISVNNIITGSNEVSIEDLRNYIIVDKGSLDTKTTKKGKVTGTPYQAEIASDEESINLYGKMVHIETATGIGGKDATSDAMQQKANTLLDSLNIPTVTSNIEFLGDIKCITGRQINIEDNMTGLTGTFFITTDSHSWDSGVYKMQLQISKDIYVAKRIRNRTRTGGGWVWQ